MSDIVADAPPRRTPSPEDRRSVSEILASAARWAAYAADATDGTEAALAGMFADSERALLGDADEGMRDAA